MKKGLKVVIVSPMSLPIPDVKGGAIERLITMLIEENEKWKKLEIYVISPYNKEAELISKHYQNTRVYFLNKANEKIQKIYWLFYRFCKKIFKFRLKVRSYEYYAIIRRIKSIAPDYVVAEGRGELEPLVNVMGRDRLYLHIHHEFLPDKYMYYTFGHIIAVSAFLKRRWLNSAYGRNVNVSVVRNAIDEARFLIKISSQERDKIRQSLRINNTDVVALFCGRIIPVKGLDKLLDAVERICASNFKLLVIGSSNFAESEENSYTGMVLERIKKMSNVRHMGFVNNADLYKYYQCSDFMIIPSILEEASGLVSIEAMYSGLPVIATKSGGLQENLNEECSMTISKDKDIVENMVSSINFLIDNPEIRENMGRAARENAKKYTKQKYYQDFCATLGCC